jgi:uncharacterized membrane protein HdeD (DUF308 family)
MGWNEWRQRRRLLRELSVLSGHSSRMMWLLPPFVPVLLLVVAVERPVAEGGSLFNIVFWGVVAGLIAVVFAVFQFEKYRARRFLLSLREQRDRVGKAEIFVGEMPLSLQSELVQFEVCVSMFLLYAQFRTAYVMEERSRPLQIFASALSLLFGWWALHGPYVTVKSLLVNARGGHRVSVEALLKQVPP